MAALIIGKVVSGKKKNCEVKWNRTSKEVYVSYAGWTHIGKANSAAEAITKVEAWLYNK